MHGAVRGDDVSKVTDEHLVRSVRLLDCLSARNELILRHHRPVANRIARAAAHWRLSAADREDLCQDAVFWILEAVRRYDGTHLERRNGARFRSFLHLIVSSRLRDSLRRLQRLRTRGLCGSGRDDSLGIAAPANGDGSGNGSRRLSSPDPAASVERNEVMATLRLAIDKLECPMRRLWSLLSDGVSLRAIANETGMSYDMVKRRRRKLICQLRIKLKARPGKSVRVRIARRNKNR